MPTYGNLFIADLPNGKPEQITFLADGGAVRPSFCPDGSRLVYWQEPYGNLYVLDMNSKKVRLITESDSFSSVQWLDNARLILISPAMGTDESLNVKLISLAGDEPMVKEITPKKPALSAEQQRITQDMAVRLFLVFRIYRDAVTAQDLHRIGEAQAKYGEARDLIAAVIEELDSGAGSQNKASSVPGLGRDDLYPYLEVMEKEAAMTPDERSVKVVRDNLEFYIASLLKYYYKHNKAFPETLEELARWAPTDRWRINYISSEDKEVVRRLFVVPGDNPDEVITSYKLIRAGKKKWVIQTPTLPNGKRFKATYQLNKRRRVDAEITEVD
ncbi:MAG TPA: hypothetical protein ENH43_00055 [Phycisphaerales bacterium]|nr:hypothetical protein [Phycisphaerales bacterium]